MKQHFDWGGVGQGQVALFRRSVDVSLKLCDRSSLYPDDKHTPSVPESRQLISLGGEFDWTT